MGRCDHRSRERLWDEAGGSEQPLIYG